MIPTEDILKTLEMVQIENLDVRAVTLGINVMACADGDSARMLRKIRSRIHAIAGNLVACCDECRRKNGIAIVKKRLAVSKNQSPPRGPRRVRLPASGPGAGRGPRDIGVDIIGG